MASFAEARANRQDVPVSQVDAPGVQDTATGQAIQSFGQLAGDARRGLLRRELRNELNESSLIVNALNAPESVVTPQGVDISVADPSGELDRSTEKFRRLELARQQGRIDENTVALEAETLMRQSIAKAPAFAEEFRQIAGRSVGFDVTGAAARTFFGMGRPGRSAGSLTEQERVALRGQEYLGIPFADTMRVQAVLEQRELVRAGRDLDLEENRIAAADYALQYSSELESDGLGTIAFNMNEQGVIENPEAVKFQLRKQHGEYVQRAQAQATRNGAIDFNLLDQLTAPLNASLQAQLDMVDDADALKVLNRRRDTINTAITLQGQALFPQLMSIRNTLGETALQTFMNMLSASQGNAGIMDRIAEVSPNVANARQLLSNQTPADLQSILDATFNGTAAFTLTDSQRDAAGSFSEFGAEDAMRNNDMDTASKHVVTQLDVGKVKAPFSQVAQKSQMYDKLDTTAKNAILLKYDADVQDVMNRMAQALADTPFHIAWNADQQQFTFVSRDGSPFLETAFQGSNIANMPQGSNLDYINRVLVGFQTNNVTFTRDAGISDTNAWALSLATQVNTMADPRVQSSVIESPSNAGNLTRLDPGVFQDDNGNIFRIGEDGTMNTLGLVRRDSSRDEIAERIRAVATQKGIEPDLAVAIATVESSLRPDARNPESSATGLFQNTDANFADFGQEGGDRTDPEVSIDAGTNFLRFLMENNSNMDDVIRKYHDGQNSSAPFSDEAEEYLRRVKAELNRLGS